MLVPTSHWLPRIRSQDTGWESSITFQINENFAANFWISETQVKDNLFDPRAQKMKERKPIVLQLPVYRILILASSAFKIISLRPQTQFLTFLPFTQLCQLNCQSHTSLIALRQQNQIFTSETTVGKGHRNGGASQLVKKFRRMLGKV